MKTIVCDCNHGWQVVVLRGHLPPCFPERSISTDLYVSCHVAISPHHSLALTIRAGRGEKSWGRGRGSGLSGWRQSWPVAGEMWLDACDLHSGTSSFPTCPGPDPVPPCDGRPFLNTRGIVQRLSVPIWVPWGFQKKHDAHEERCLTNYKKKRGIFSPSLCRCTTAQPCLSWTRCRAEVLVRPWAGYWPSSVRGTLVLVRPSHLTILVGWLGLRGSLLQGASARGPVSSWPSDTKWATGR